MKKIKIYKTIVQLEILSTERKAEDCPAINSLVNAFEHIEIVTKSKETLIGTKAISEIKKYKAEEEFDLQDDGEDENNSQDHIWSCVFKGGNSKPTKKEISEYWDSVEEENMSMFLKDWKEEKGYTKNKIVHKSDVKSFMVCMNERGLNKTYLKCIKKSFLLRFKK